MKYLRWWLPTLNKKKGRPRRGLPFAFKLGSSFSVLEIIVPLVEFPFDSTHGVVFPTMAAIAQHLQIFRAFGSQVVVVAVMHLQLARPAALFAPIVAAHQLCLSRFLPVVRI